MRRRTPLLAASILLVAVALGFHPAREHIRAFNLLKSMEGGQPAVTGWMQSEVTESLIEVPVGATQVRARLYWPKGVRHPAGMVLAPGIHHLGIEEPRIVRLARALSGSGIAVLTPEVQSLADYRVDPDAIEIIGRSAQHLSKQLEDQRVGVMGISFAGSLALLAAAGPAYQRYIGLVVTVGSHHDMRRVAHFFLTDQIATPDGTIVQMKAHEYGILVLLYAHVAEDFPAADVAAARDALRLWLWEQPDAARENLREMTPASRASLEKLFAHDYAGARERIRTHLAEDASAMQQVSPAGRLAGLKAAVFLLHGAGDNVIPPTELAWLERDVPAASLRAALVSRAISHAEVEGAPGLGDSWALVHFMAGVLEETENVKPVEAAS